MMRVLDLFSGAAGGWSLGLHRAGLTTIAACEIVEWRRILYSENFPHVRLYADVRDLTAARLVSDLGCLPEIIVGSPPCQDISSANTKGKGIEGERSGLYLEAVRLVGDCRPRWFAFENSANLRTRGADRLLDELEALGYACWPCVVGAADIGANHVRKRSWLIGCDPEQLADARVAIPTGWDASGRGLGRKAMKESGLSDLFRNRPLPTPMASEGMKDGAGGGAGSTYPLRMILATPRKTDADRGGRGDLLSQLQGHASRHAGMMGTPTANAAPRGSVLRRQKGRMTSGQDRFDRSPTIGEALHFDRRIPEILPTPTKRDSRMTAGARPTTAANRRRWTR